ncbi:MAG: tyrosine--tRNA ligase [Paenibacillus macerans]|uniref:Tyrosine--tRNA ligase n=1 Tax=Paenibacillus macerans TaxID=44252 RepID=A0A6N8F0S7_PAEMA|nr:tyrosine--tRNA ligase [Paenibacillus macerans]MDU7477148.1 tyrosine--tRNA ligase [Paenibacillus macerans]MEC0333447.1 tyrosine--tRNA ligase [Paenibacillus macerans]MUG24211.1 tyrosine--tRNA ligase [Paenibacillus macerans]UMV50495.1 tyrosine--tRNA ligase [Paenibacillus macerans]GBK60549.1 tyrosine--tRNA ligase [Paenibacillus macerans]
MNLLEDLKFRGLIHQCTDLEGLAKKLAEGSIRLYAGFDPTANSLHIGHLLPILTLRRFQLAGHSPYALVGGSTGLIGDPTGRSVERPINTKETVEAWTESIKLQLSRFLEFDHAPNAARVFNNYDWFASINIIEFLRDCGTCFTINYMLAKETVQSRLNQGVSFAELSYMLLQAYDFAFLHKEYDCALQIGGSDQWGNITAGLEMIDKVLHKKAYGLTMPLVMKKDGTKFGKTAGGAVWLDPQLTSPYEFYQFWLNTDDADVVPFLKYFTFLECEEILEYEEALTNKPEERAAQRALAKEVTALVHGGQEASTCEKASEILFRGELHLLAPDDLEAVSCGVSTIHVDKREKMTLLELLILSGAAPSKRQAREDFQAGAVYLNGFKATDPDLVVGEGQRLHQAYAVIRRGKKSYHLVKFQ